MRIRSLEVAGFRPLRDVELPLDDLTMLLGPNGSGKSSLLAALRLFFDPRRPLDERDIWKGLNRETADEVSIAVTFNRLTPSAREAFTDYLDPDDSLRVERHFNEPGPGIYLAHRAAVPDFSTVRNLPKGHRDAYNELVASGRFDGLETARNKDEAFGRMAAWEAANPGQCERVAEEVAFLRDPAGSPTAVATYLTFLFVGALEQPSVHLDAQGQGAIAALIREVVDTAALDERFASIAAEADSQAREILAASQPLFDEFEAATAASLERFAHGFSVRLAWAGDVRTSTAQPRIQATVRRDDGLETDLEYQGQGIQRSLMYGVLTARVTAEQAEDGRTLLLAIEEPEAFQHPLSARVLADTLRDLSERRFQVIHTTHSPDLLGPRTMRGIRLVGRTDDRAATSVEAFDLARFVARMSEATGNDTFTEESSAARLEANLERHVLEGLFARACVVVEGAEDEAIIRAACQRAGMPLDRAGVAVVQTRGKRSIPLLVAFLTQAGVPCYPLFDLDRDKDDDSAQNRGAERELLSLLGEDASTELEGTDVTPGYACFEHNLGATVAQELGGQYADALQAASEDLGFALKQGRKVAPVLRRALESAAEAGLESDALLRVVDVVGALATE